MTSLLERVTSMHQSLRYDCCGPSGCGAPGCTGASQDGSGHRPRSLPRAGGVPGGNNRRQTRQQQQFGDYDRRQCPQQPWNNYFPGAAGGQDLQQQEMRAMEMDAVRGKRSICIDPCARLANSGTICISCQQLPPQHRCRRSSRAWSLSTLS